jgi:hypothetical protein
VTHDLLNASWRKPTRSSGGENNCVEVALTSATAGIRDTKDRSAGHLEVTHAEFAAFLRAVSTLGH